MKHGDKNVRKWNVTPSNTDRLFRGGVVRRKGEEHSLGIKGMMITLPSVKP